jgi:hypothetical protein
LILPKAALVSLAMADFCASSQCLKAIIFKAKIFPNDGKNDDDDPSSAVLDDPGYFECHLLAGLAERRHLCQAREPKTWEFSKTTCCLASCRPLERHSPRELLRTLCLSRSGWTGLECSQRVEVCGDGEQYIYLHGSTCVSSSDDGKHACDCSDANQGKALTLLVGDSCQHATTDVCTLGEPSSRGRSFYFCMNVTVDQPHPGWAPTVRSPGKEVIPRSDRSSV